MARRKLSVASRIALVASLSLLPIIAVAALTAIELRQRVLRDSQFGMGRQLAEMSYRQSLVTENTRLLLSTLAETEEVKGLDIPAMTELLRRCLDRNPLYVTLMAFDVDGRALASGREFGAGFSIGDRPYYARLRRNLDFCVGEYAISRSTGRPTLHFAYPILDHRREDLIGLLVASYDLGYYAQLFRDSEPSPGKRLEVFDRSGRRLFSNPADQGRLVGDYASREDLDLGLAFNHGRTRLSPLRRARDGSVSLGAALRLDGDMENDLYLVLRYPESYLLASTNAVMMRSLLIIMGSVALSLLMLRSLSQSAISRPLEKLVRVTQGFGIGEYRLRASEEEGARDVVSLAKAFNEMAEALARRQSETAIAEERTLASLREKEVLLREIHHRVKNNFQIISSMLSLQAEGISDPQAQAAFLKSQNRIESMALVHEHLYLSKSLSQIDFSEYIATIVEELRSSYWASEAPVELSLRCCSIHLSIDLAVPLALILNELVTNALKHAFGETGDKKRLSGTIRVSLSMIGDGQACLEVADDGIGMGLGQGARRIGLGMELVRSLCAQLRGSLSLGPGLSSFPERPGMAVKLVFPLERGGQGLSTEA